jgi:hypothetical protein
MEIESETMITSETIDGQWIYLVIDDSCIEKRNVKLAIYREKDESSMRISIPIYELSKMVKTAESCMEIIHMEIY